MEFDTIFLSIYIPTYNRPQQLQRQVRQLLPQLSANVKLVVRDNCSPVSVDTLFTDEELCKFTIVRNSINIGADANICRCFEECESKWLWVLSDDDLVKNNAVKSVLMKLEELDSSMLFVNFDNQKEREVCGFNEFCEYISPQVYINSFWISVCLYNMDLLKPYLRCYYENLSTMIGSLISLLNCLAIEDSKKCCFCDIKLIENAELEVSWDKTLYIERSIMLIDYFKNSNLEIIKKTVIKSMLNVDASFFLMMIKQKTYNKSHIFYLLRRLIVINGALSIIYYNSYFLMKTLAVLIIPRKLLLAIFK